jgi:LmbE family N-acetylglucosaminyl deacetylase
LLAFATNATAQLPSEDYRGVVATGLALRELATTKRVLLIAAHPDDEDTQLLSVLRLGQGADVAYLSLTRGEGGQNSIGGELGPALGILRTGELLAARKLDRAEQFFTRAYDFGYSKTAEETLSHWPKDSILADVVAVVRRFRPDIIVAVFTGTPSDGHGHHQVSGLLAREAFQAAADPSRFADQLRDPTLRPHRALKLFHSANFRGTPTHRLSTGDWDPLLGRSYSQVAAVSRSRHRSQDFGQAQTPGPRTTAVELEVSQVSAGANGSIFAGMDTTLSAKAVTAREAVNVVRALERYDSLIASAQERLSAYRSDAVASVLATVVRELAAIRPAIRDEDLDFAVGKKHVAAQRALLQAAGIVIDAVSGTETIVPGESFTLDVSVWNAGRQAVRLAALSPVVRRGWRVERTDSAADSIAPATMVTWKYKITAPTDAAINQPYFLEKPRVGDLYAWPSSRSIAGLPFEPADVQAVAIVEIGGARAQMTVDATRRVVDPRQGELRRAVHIAPAFTVRPDPTTAVIASGTNRSIDARVEVGSNGAGGQVVVKPQLPAGWRAVPAEATLTLSGSAAFSVATFAIEPPRGVASGSYAIPFVAVDANGRSYDLAQRAIDYAHVVNRVMYEPAVLRVNALDVQLVRGMRIGYIVGVDHDVPPVLEQLGITVDRLDEAALAMGDLGKYDAVVIGSRAYEMRPDLIAHNARVLDYGRKGGNVLVLYQQYGFVRGNFAPYALTIERPHDRITDEHAPVRLLAADAPALTRPNRITNRDFEGWLQERALYMPRTWAQAYASLLEMTDPGEAPKQGAIITAPLGSGHYTYTGIAFFRQIPAGVPGALRLFVNLLSLGMKNAAL